MSRPRHAVGGGVAAAVLAVTTAALARAGAVTADPTDPPTPELVGLPPATADIDVAPVVGLIAPASELVAPVNELITRTGSLDGALSEDTSRSEKRFTLAGDVFFENDSAALTERARADLAKIAAELADNAPESAAVVGHTDSVGTDAHNDELSRARAEAVSAFLTGEVPGLDVTAEGRGEREPVAAEEGSPEQVEHARALNRRVEITATLAPAG